jgi:hypothetical protein
MATPGLNERERRVLEAVIQTYVETAQPAGSRSLAHKFGLGVSPATIRNTMSDLEEKGYLYHPHASAGRVPTDVAYRVYVDSLIPIRPPGATERRRLTAQITTGGSAVEAILRRAAQSLGVITQELGIALTILPGLACEGAVARAVYDAGLLVKQHGIEGYRQVLESVKGHPMEDFNEFIGFGTVREIEGKYLPPEDTAKYEGSIGYAPTSAAPGRPRESA